MVKMTRDANEQANKKKEKMKKKEQRSMSNVCETGTHCYGLSLSTTPTGSFS